MKRENGVNQNGIFANYYAYQYLPSSSQPATSSLYFKHSI